MNRRSRGLGSLAMMMATALLMIGCSSPTMQRHDVTVALAEDVGIGADTYTVYLTGVSGDENALAKMKSASVDDFIRQDDLRRLSPTVTFTLNKDNASPKTLAADAKVWEEWRSAGVMNLFVIADTPEAPADRSAMGDTRRVIIPLGSNRWNGQTKIRVTLRRSAISYAPTPPNPEKK
ncbi:MAG: hypothetical protein AB7G11_14700 [Phycisphaerales bacterium]